jgi:hypothetical protein
MTAQAGAVIPLRHLSNLSHLCSPLEWRTEAWAVARECLPMEEQFASFGRLVIR